jgi:predicted permease
LLLAACANIAGLLLARASARSREIATRLALGASRARLVRQLITESLVLSFAGGAIGLILALTLSGAGTALLSQFMPTLFGADRALNLDAMLDGRLLAFAAGLSLLSGLLFGTVPALGATRLDLIAAIKDNSCSGVPRFGLTGGQAMVAAQTMLAVCLLVGAGLFMRTLTNLRSTDLGFRTDGLLYARIEPRSGGLAQAQRRQFFEDAVARLRALPGVVAAGATGHAPLGADSSVGVGNFTVPFCGAARRQGTSADLVTLNTASPGYFDTLDLRLLDGRDFTTADTFRPDATVRPLIVNEAFAREFFPGASTVGQEISFGNDCARPAARLTIIGVVEDSRAEVRTQPAPAIFAPLEGFQGPVTLIVRTSGDPAAMIPTVRRAMTELNANTPTFSEAPVADLVERRLRRERLLSSLLTVFAAVTVFICCLGIYGMLSYAVERRRQEISVRMAIGAQTSDVIGLMVRESLLPVGCGLVAGALVSIAANRWLAQLLYGVSSYDPLTLAGASVLFLLVAVAAAALPSRAAARVNPVLALRQ